MKDKLVNILLLVAILLLGMNLLFSKPRETVPATGIVLSAQKEYSVPAGVQIAVHNYTSEPFAFHTKDISIKNGSNTIIPPTDEEISLESGASYTLDLQDEYQLFLQTGEYFVELNVDDISTKTMFEIKYRGMIGKFFIAVFYAPIYNLMAFILEMTSYQLGWAIVIITVLIRLALLWPQHKMMVSQAKMQKIQPKIQEIQEKNKGDNAALGMELMALYKKEGVNPLGSCGLLLIQMPILIVIYRVILGIQDQSNMFYLYSFLSDYRLTNIHANFYGIDLFTAGGIAGAILAVSIGILQYIQVKMSLYFQEQNKPQSKKDIVLEKKKDAKDYSSLMPDPNVMNKFMLYGMPIMVTIITYTLYAGVGIYWWVATIFMIGQQIVVNKILKKA